MTSEHLVEVSVNEEVELLKSEQVLQIPLKTEIEDRPLNPGHISECPPKRELEYSSLLSSDTCIDNPLISGIFDPLPLAPEHSSNVSLKKETEHPLSLSSSDHETDLDRDNAVPNDSSLYLEPSMEIGTDPVCTSDGSVQDSNKYDSIISGEDSLTSYKEVSDNENLLLPVGKREFVCCECGEAFGFKRALTTHKKTHNPEALFTCKECGKSYIHEVSLKMHLKSHMSENPFQKTFQCNECGKTFSHKTKYTIHMTRHSGIKPYPCSYCEKAFFDRDSLNKHLISLHTGDSPYQCEMCGKAFGGKIDFTRHMRIHTKERPFKCSECGKTFIQNSHLADHMTSHSKEKAFICDECGKAFSLKQSLRVHKETHSGNRRYVCVECGKAFNQKKGLSRHMMIHRREPHLTCNICGKSLSEKSSLARHMKTHGESTKGQENTQKELEINSIDKEGSLD